MKNSYFLCITQPTNLGDLLINKMLVDELCQYGITYIDVKRTPAAFKRHLLEDPNAIDVYEQFRVTIKGLQILKFPVFIKKNNISLYTSSPGPMGKGKFVYNLVLKLAELFSHFAGSGNYKIGSCCSSMISNREVLIDNQLDGIYLRSLSSVNHLSPYFKDRCHFIPDLAFMYYDKAQISEKQDTIAVTFRDDSNVVDFFDKCKSIIDSFLNFHYKVIFYYQVDCDRVYMERLYQDYYDNPNVSFNQRKLWWDDLSFYSDKKIIVSNRLHALLLGAVHLAIPFVCLSESSLISKLKDVFDSSFGQYIRDLYIHFDVNNSINKILENYLFYKKSIESDVYRNSQECKQIINAIVNKQ